MIKVQALTKRYRDVTVLNDMNLEVKEGEVVSVIGPSGSGKSTLLRCLNLLEKPDVGIICINDVTIDATKFTRYEAYQLRQQTAMVFQHYNLFRNKTALENVTEPLIYGKRWSKQEAIKKAEALLGRVGLADHRDQYPVTLSGGQQQRVSIARALAVEPKAILFDEPTSSLDPELVGEVLTVIDQLVNDGMTLLIVTHEMDFAKRVSDRVIFMDEGAVVEEGPAEAVIANPQNPRTKLFLKRTLDRPNYGPR